MMKFKKLLALSLILVGAFSLAGCKPVEEGPTDLEKLAEALDELDLAATASSDLTLLSTGLHDVEITWTSSNTAVIANDGTLTIPLFTEGDKVVTITASLTLGDDTLTKAFEVTVLAAATITDAELLADAVGRLLLSHDDLVVSDIVLPDTVDLTDIAEDVIVTWASSNTDVVTAAGIITRPANGEGNAILTLTATLTYNDETDTKQFSITVREEEPSVAFATIAAMHTGSVLGDIVEFQGIVTGTFDGGYFLSDGTHALGIYNPSSIIGAALGDEVYVKGSYAVYNTLYQIGDVTVETVISTGNAIPLTAVEKTVAEMLALDSSDPLIHGMYYTVTGTLTIIGSYGNIYLVDGDDELLIYYYSLESSILALEAEVGKEVTITVFYYTDHGTNGVMVAFDGGAADIDVFVLNDVDALAADLASVGTGVAEVTIADDIVLPTVGANGTVFTNWTSDNLEVILNDGTFVAGALTTVTVTFTADATKGAETGVATIEVVVPILSTIGEVLAMNNGDFFQVTGVVYEESHYGFFIHADGNYIFVYDNSFLDEVIPGQEITILGFLGSYSGLSQVNVISYEVGSTQNGLVGAIISSVSALEFDLVQRGTIAIVTGTISLEGSYDDVFITGPAGGKVKVYYRSNADELVGFEGDIVTITLVTYQDGTVLYQGVAAEVTVQVDFTDKQLAKATVDAIDLGDLDNIESDMTLPLENTTAGTTIVWSTSDATIVAADGVITRTPGEDTYATLTATVIVGTETKTRNFEVTVLDANGATPINVAAALALADGDSVLVVGVVTGFYYDEPMIQDPDGTAIYINSAIDCEIGDEIVIRGTLYTYTSSGNTQRRLNDAYELETLSVGNALFIFDTYTVDEVYTLYPATSSQRITLTNVVIAEINDGYGYAFIASGTQNIKFKFPAYWEDVYEIGDTIASITFNVVDINYDNLRVSEVELPVLTEAQNMLAAKGMIDFPEIIMGDVTLDSAIADYGATITWASDNEAVISLAGVVTQPLNGEGNIAVALTATITVGTTVEVVVYDVTVGEEPPAVQPLFFSEYGEPNGGNCKYVEIYNPTDAAVNLANYYVVKGGNGKSFAESTDIENLTGMLAAGAVIVIGNPACFTGADAGSVDGGFPQSGLNYIESTVVGYVNGDDALGLFFIDDTLIDTIGLNGEDPGSYWPVGNGNITDGDTQNVVLIRIPTVTSGEPDWAVGALQWIVLDHRDYADVGTHTVS